jgi:hypothetical protein
MKMVRQKCDPPMVEELDESRLSADFAKPAQRASAKAGILATREPVTKSPGGLTPAATAVLPATLKSSG